VGSLRRVNHGIGATLALAGLGFEYALWMGVFLFGLDVAVRVARRT
jgi:hypothetical protein